MIRDLTESLTYPLWALLAKMHSEDKTDCAKAIDADNAIGSSRVDTRGQVRRTL